MNPLIMTEAGDSENQDRAAIVQENDQLVLVAADGAGGQSGGTEAAQMAVDFVRQASPRLRTADECARALREMDARISGDPVAGETTCVVVVVRSTGLFGASVGDSGAWLIGSEGFENLTRFQARKPFIGSGVAYPVPFTFAPRPSGMLLLATDGLLKYTSAESICRVCRNSRTGATANELLQLVRLSSGRLPDDTTLILYQL